MSAAGKSTIGSAGGWLLAGLSWLIASPVGLGVEPSALGTTQPLTIEGDIASQMVDGIDLYLLNKTRQSIGNRSRHWQRDLSSLENYIQSLQHNRQRLASILGVVEPRVPAAPPVRELQLADAAGSYRVTAVRWPVLEDPDPQRSIVSVSALGLLLEPLGDQPAVADVIIVSDCDQSLADVCGLNADGADHTTLPQRLVQRNFRVLLPLLINRQEQPRHGRPLPNREYVYRPSFVLGRHVIGYELQKLLSAVDWLQSTTTDKTDGRRDVQAKVGKSRPIAVLGVGEGGQLALYAAALDQRIDALGLWGSFGPLEQLWQQPIDRNVFGLLDQFGGAELLSMVAPRPTWIAHAPTPLRILDSQAGRTPGALRPVSARAGHQELERAQTLVKPWVEGGQWKVIETDGYAAAAEQSIPAATPEPFPAKDLHAFLQEWLGQQFSSTMSTAAGPLTVLSSLDEAAAQQQAVEELDRHNQLLLRESPFVREQFMSSLKTDSLANFKATVEQYRNVFRDEVIGSFDDQLLPVNPRARQVWSSDRWTGYEVVLDVFPDVIAYGVLLLPTDLQAGQKLPVVVCQHGLEGRPTDTFQGDHPAYHDFAARLCEQGYIVFAPQNLYLFKDRFRSLQRKANPLGKTLFSIIVPQHQQIVNWLKTLPNVDPQRIGFYGLSYGGKSAMRIPALVTDYSLSICSADFNEWVVKNASTRDNFSYVWTGEYEIFEWNLGSTFNYAEMATLICPRPFMVERGHFDGVGKDPWVAYEYAKVRNLYAAQLKIGERTEIEWFDGPHTIHGEKSFEFLRRHLQPPSPRATPR